MKTLRISTAIVLFLIFSISCDKSNYKTHEAMFFNNSSVTIYDVKLHIKGHDNIVKIDSLMIGEETNYYAFRFEKSHTSGCTTTTSPSIGDFEGEYVQDDSLKSINIMMPYNDKTKIKITILDDSYIVE
ncbi:MAG: hypothetical protein RAP70_02365 [Candidatus Celaenobacter antarcticus]|nr:hypothetical protein [Candidatus Celaenobacter antarcticus]MDP8313898.1 hypothetical protein [Candidatus Celaenobacter antarcticus]